MLRSLLRHRRFILTLARANLRRRYAGTNLGVFWSLFHPLCEFFVYLCVFSRVAPSSSYALYLCAGLVPWLNFVEMLFLSSQALRENAPHLRRLPLPREVFVAATALSSGFALWWTIGFLYFTRPFFGLALDARMLIWIVPMILLWQLLALFVGLCLADLSLLFPDLGELLRPVLEIWKWTLPVVYPLQWLPLQVLNWLPWNPPACFILGFRSILLENQPPSSQYLLICLGWVCLAASTAVFLRKITGDEVLDLL